MATRSIGKRTQSPAQAETARRNWQIKTWKQIGRLAAATQEALDAGNTPLAKQLLAALRGVALTADQDGL